MKKRKNFIFGKIAVITMLLVVVLTSFYIFKLHSDKQIESQTNLQKIRLEKEKVENQHLKIDEEKISSIDNVMIVAHPDDETLWGGEQLLKENYLVICITNGDNKIRKKEFEKVMEETKDYGIILNYPDNPKGVKSDWKKEKASIKKDIDYILGYKKWNKIVTHNPEGEYGHIHHKMTNQIVTKECKKKDLTKNLYYFAHYYKKDELKSKGIVETLNEQEIRTKQNIMENMYPSQARAYHLFEHMIPYEKLITFQDWNSK